MRPYVRHRFDLTVVGDANLPSSGPMIIAANHVGFLDGPLIALMAPRPVHLLTKFEMFEGPMGVFLTLTGQIPVHRDEPDPASVRGALEVLRQGRVLGIFPEGGRGAGELTTVQRGAGYFALATGACVVPTVLLGTREPGADLESIPPDGSRIVITYGEPLRFDAQPWPRRTNEVREATSRIRNAMLATLRSAQDATGMTLPGPVPEGDPND